MRNLFIGLGGTGGQVLKLLRGMMSEEQRRDASYLYLDTSKNATEHQIAEGIKTVRISTADTVEDLAAELGLEDGVYDWLPDVEAEPVFMSSGFDDGASQNRYKSRLCIARFLSQENNELRNMLHQLNLPSSEARNTMLRVFIVSSVAGGTGTGTFLDIALYIRKYFRDRNQNIRITGLFGCPDIYVGVNAHDPEKRRSMFANAYASIRELNAMNMCVGGSRAVSNDYGKSINIKIDTRSEGKLFDSNDPYFTGSYNAKPFDLLYFVDQENADGFELGNLQDYYHVMADIAYTRLYSPLEGAIQDDESNEMNRRATVPTAIYGSAGYAKIVYPYEDILRYLAERKVSEDLGSKWTFCENAWNAYCQRQRRSAKASGSTWVEEPEEREDNYITNINNAIEKTGSSLAFLADMIRTPEGEDRVELYLDRLEAQAKSRIGINSGDAGREDAPYGLGVRKDVSEARSAVSTIYVKAANKSGSKPMDALSDASTISGKLKNYASVLKRAAVRQAQVLAAAIFPLNENGVEQEEATSDQVNIRTGLLVHDGKDVHPLAARYMLYSLRQQLRGKIERYGGKDNPLHLSNKLDVAYKSVYLYFDDDWDDGKDITADQYIAQLNKKRVGRNKASRDDLEEYLETIGKAMEAVINAATDEMLYQTWVAVMENLDALISQYEGFFANVEQFADSLTRQTRQDEAAHDVTTGSYVYVGATAEVKKYYYLAAPGVAGAIQAGNDEIYAYEGSCVYQALIKRAMRSLAKKHQMEQMGQVYRQKQEDTYSDMGGIFDAVVDRYVGYLRDKASYLDTDVCTAMVRECCQELDVDASDLINDPAAQTRFQTAFHEKVSELIVRSRPMVRYHKNNTEMYFRGEIDVTASYLYMAISPETAEQLGKYFPTSSKEPLEGFIRANGLNTAPVVESKFDKREMSAFQAVHCLQPTQIIKFNENSDNAYYRVYCEGLQEALAQGLLSKTGHLDKNWHRRGAMPYISRNLEMKWRKQVMKAFLYEMLARDIGFSVDGEGTRCFIFKRDGRTEFIHWPGNALVLQRNISRVMEFLSEDERYLESLAEKMDDAVRYQVRLLGNYTGSVSTYKAGMTKNGVLQLMRTNLVAALRAPSDGPVSGMNAVRPARREADESRQKRIQDNLRRLQKEISGDVDEGGTYLPDPRATMGGVLEVAWLVHQSEEKLGEDRDYGEELLACAADVIDTICQGMYGSDQIINANSTDYQQYVRLYNSVIQKFVRDYVIDCLRKGTLLEQYDEDELAAMLRADSQSSYGYDEVGAELHPMANRVELHQAQEGTYPDLKNIPQNIRDSAAFVWISKNWKLKKFQ